jgi:hypothetical protein
MLHTTIDSYHSLLRIIQCNVLSRISTFGRVSREPVSQWNIREGKLLPESIDSHNAFHSLHGSWSIHELDISYLADK